MRHTDNSSQFKRYRLRLSTQKIQQEEVKYRYHNIDYGQQDAFMKNGQSRPTELRIGHCYLDSQTSRHITMSTVIIRKKKMTLGQNLSLWHTFPFQRATA